MALLPDSQGNKYTLLSGDQFRKEYEAVAVPIQEEKSVSAAYVENWTLKFGCPVNLNNDQMSNSMSKLFCSPCDYFFCSFNSFEFSVRKAILSNTLLF